MAARAIADSPKRAATSSISSTTTAWPSPTGPSGCGTPLRRVARISPVDRGFPDATGLAARLEYLSTDGPVLSPRLPAGPVPHLSTSNLILKRDVVERTGAFDEKLAMCEDRDFTARARARGFRLLFEPAARVTHYSSVDRAADYFARMRHYGYGTSQYFAQRPEEPLARVFPKSAAARLAAAPVPGRRRDRLPGAPKPAAMPGRDPAQPPVCSRDKSRGIGAGGKPCGAIIKNNESLEPRQTPLGLSRGSQPLECAAGGVYRRDHRQVQSLLPDVPARNAQAAQGRYVRRASSSAWSANPARPPST